LSATTEGDDAAAGVAADGDNDYGAVDGDAVVGDDCRCCCCCGCYCCSTTLQSLVLRLLQS